MSRPRSLGVIVPLGVEVPKFARDAEAAGFDRLGCGEHMFFTAPTYNTFIALSAAPAPRSPQPIRPTLMMSLPAAWAWREISRPVTVAPTTAPAVVFRKSRREDWFG